MNKFLFFSSRKTSLFKYLGQLFFVALCPLFFLAFSFDTVYAEGGETPDVVALAPDGEEINSPENDEASECDSLVEECFDEGAFLVLTDQEVLGEDARIFEVLPDEENVFSECTADEKGCVEEDQTSQLELGGIEEDNVQLAQNADAVSEANEV